MSACSAGRDCKAQVLLLPPGGAWLPHPFRVHTAVLTRSRLAAPTIRIHPAAPIVRVHLAAPTSQGTFTGGGVRNGIKVSKLA
jgi:hypothetical protein